MAADRALLAPTEPAELQRAHRAASAAGIPLILGAPAQQAATFGAHAEPDAPRTIHLHHPVGDAIVLAATSGTSGRSRFVPWTEAILDYQARATMERMSTDSGTRYGLAVSPSSAYGFSVVNLTERRGGTLDYFAATDHGAITRALLDHRIDTLDTIPGVWRYLATAAAAEPALVRALRRLRVRGVGGEVVSHGLLDSYDELGTPLHNGYGLTEAGPNVSISCGAGYGRHTAGLPLTGTEVRVRTDGAVMVSGPGVAAALYDPDRGLVRNPAVDGAGRLDTGDIGSLDAAGRLTLLGRADGLFAGHGRKLHATVIEETVRAALPGDPEIVALHLDPLGSGTLRVVIALVDEGDDGPAVDLSARQRNLPIEFRVREVVRVPRSATARTGSGKLDRNQLAALVTRILREREELSCQRVS